MNARRGRLRGGNGSRSAFHRAGRRQFMWSRHVSLNASITGFSGGTVRDNSDDDPSLRNTHDSDAGACAYPRRNLPQSRRAVLGGRSRPGPAGSASRRTGCGRLQRPVFADVTRRVAGGTTLLDGGQSSTSSRYAIFERGPSLALGAIALRIGYIRQSRTSQAASFYGNQMNRHRYACRPACRR